MKTVRASLNPVTSLANGLERTPKAAGQTQAREIPLGPPPVVNKSSAPAEQLGSESIGTRAFSIVQLGRAFKPAIAAAIIGAGLVVGSPVAAAPGPVEPQTCVKELRKATVTAPTPEAIKLTPAQIQTKVGEMRGEINRVADVLRNNGSEATADHLQACMQKFAPEGAEDAPLAALIGALNGDPEAEQALRDSFIAHEIQIKPGSDAKSWKLAGYLRTGNDNASTLFDGQYRSDDGPTASLGAGMVFSLPDQEVKLDVDYQMLTERNGMTRTDLVTGLISHSLFKDAGGLTLNYGYDLGIQATGDFGGANVQDAWHGLNSDNFMRGRRLTTTLQNEYKTEQQAALLVGVHAGAVKDLGLVDLYADAEARVPVGPTGLGWVGATAGLEISGDNGGLYAQADVKARYQWTNGDAMNFAGAPVDNDAVLIPHIGVGWQGDGYRIGVDWRRNDLGTQPGMGNLHSDVTMFTLTIGGGRRGH